MKLFSPTPPPPPSPLVRYPSSSRPTNCFLHGRPWPPPPSTPLPLRWPCSLPRWAVFPTRAAVEPEPAVRREVVDVEAEIYEFMVLSAKPELFPTRGELLAAGRGDLVDAVAREGGWLAFGWDFDEEEEDGRVSQGRLDGVAPEGGSFPPEMEVAGYSGRELETESSGIEGILNGLEKERSLSFGLGTLGKEDRWGDFSSNETVGGRGTGGQSNKLTARSDLFNDYGVAYSGNGSLADLTSDMNDSNEAETWRAWSSQRAAAYQRSEFEAGEIVLSNHGKGAPSGHHSAIDSSSTVGSPSELSSGDKENLQSHVHSRLRQLEEELSSTLKYLRTERVSDPSNKKSSPEELHKISDTWEFQQTEIMKTRDKLRSIRARLSVLEGKMTMGIIEAQKLVEEKQKKIIDAKKALRLLQTVCIVWANSASEVLLAGSFDGWTSQRRMERSASGIFILNLKLYPGRYEMKFIVDGVWMVDPLRPIGHSDGFENNLLIVP